MHALRGFIGQEGKVGTMNPADYTWTLPDHMRGTGGLLLQLLRLRARAREREDLLTREQEREANGQFGAGGPSSATIAEGARGGAFSPQAAAKIAAAPVPTAADRAAHTAMVAKQGGTRAGGDGRGSSKDRAARTGKLLNEFGDGKHCPCSYCGTKLDAHTLTQDRIYPGSAGGRYIYANLLPACGHCNSSRGDSPIPGLR